MTTRTFRILAFTGILVAGLAAAAQAQKPLAPPSIRPSRGMRASCGWCRRPRIVRRARPGGRYASGAVRRYQDGDYAGALTALSRLPPSAALDDYIDYYTGLAQLRLKKYPEARKTLTAIVDRKPQGAVSLRAALAQGEAAEAGRQPGRRRNLSASRRHEGAGHRRSAVAARTCRARG